MKNPFSKGSGAEPEIVGKPSSGTVSSLPPFAARAIQSALGVDPQQVIAMLQAIYDAAMLAAQRLERIEAYVKEHDIVIADQNLEISLLRETVRNTSPEASIAFGGLADYVREQTGEPLGVGPGGNSDGR